MNFRRNCLVSSKVGPYPTNAQKDLIRTTIEVTARDSVEELGDMSRKGPDFAADCIGASGTIGKLDRSAATEIVSAVGNCIQQRYLGNCAAAASCEGRKVVEPILSEINVTSLLGKAYE